MFHALLWFFKTINLNKVLAKILWWNMTHITRYGFSIVSTYKKVHICKYSTFKNALFVLSENAKNITFGVIIHRNEFSLHVSYFCLINEYFDSFSIYSVYSSHLPVSKYTSFYINNWQIFCMNQQSFSETRDFSISLFNDSYMKITVITVHLGNMLTYLW